MWSYLGPLLIYWLVLFVACFVVTEVAQDQLYDEVTPRVGLKIAIGSLILAVLMVIFPASYDTMFTANIAWTFLHGIVWFAVFTLIFQFHPPHALGLGLATFLLVSGFATMGVESLTKPTPQQAKSPVRVNNPPVRQSLAPKAPTSPPATKQPQAASPPAKQASPAPTAAKSAK